MKHPTTKQKAAAHRLYQQPQTYRGYFCAYDVTREQWYVSHPISRRDGSHHVCTAASFLDAKRCIDSILDHE